MSEFKYACPVCGQHIKCDSSQAGATMDCPTCFQKITVPQAPASADQKFILTGTKAGERKTSVAAAAANPRTTEPAARFAAATVALVLLVVLAAGAGVYFYRGTLFPSLAPWKVTDIGAVGLAGTFGKQGESLTIAGSGADIWGQTDAFRYVCRAVNGDVTLTARVIKLQNTDPWAKAGLMVRDSFAPDSANVMICITPNNGISFQRRPATGAPAASVFSLPRLHAPYWVRLTRQGNLFTAEAAADGKEWKPAGSTTMALKEGVYAGLAVCSHKAATLCQAAFDQVAIQGANSQHSPSNPPSNTTVPMPSNPPVPVTPPANSTNWMLALGTNALPETPAAGRLHGQDFALEHASFQNGALLLRKGAHGPVELGVSLNFSGAPAEELAGRTLNVTTNAEKAALVTLRWKDGDGPAQKLNYESGYALRLQFGALANNRLSGKIYLCLPDPEKSYVSGAFTATVSKPKPKPEQKPPSP